jgi:hypothetical protein
MDCLPMGRGRETRLTGLAYLFLSHLIAVNPDPPQDAGHTPPVLVCAAGPRLHGNELCA